MIRVATANVPHRLRPHDAAVQRLADRGAAIIVTQEEADGPGWTPRGWRRFRPRRARSVCIYWNPDVVTRMRKGAKRLSRPGFRSPRYGVWCHFRTPEGPLRIMGVHLPAFYAASTRNRREYDRQARKVARWASRGRFRVVAGDFNGSVTGARMRPLIEVLAFSDKAPTGPAGQTIDYVAAAKHGPWRVVETCIMPAGRSDHRPVLAGLTTHGGDV